MTVIGTLFVVGATTAGRGHGVHAARNDCFIVDSCQIEMKWRMEKRVDCS